MLFIRKMSFNSVSHWLCQNFSSKWLSLRSHVCQLQPYILTGKAKGRNLSRWDEKSCKDSVNPPCSHDCRHWNPPSKHPNILPQLLSAVMTLPTISWEITHVVSRCNSVYLRFTFSVVVDCWIRPKKKIGRSRFSFRHLFSSSCCTS